MCACTHVRVHRVKSGSGSISENHQFPKVIPIAFSAVKLTRVAVVLSPVATWEPWGTWDSLITGVGVLRNPQQAGGLFPLPSCKLWITDLIFLKVLI